MKKIAIITKYLPYYRLAVFNQLSLIKKPIYEIIGDKNGREGIKTIPEDILNKNSKESNINWRKSKSYYYQKSLQLWQTNVVTRIFSKKYDLFILDGAISHITTWLFAILCRLTGKKIIFWSHGLKGTDIGIKKKIRIFFFKYLPHGLILYGDFSKNVMVGEGFNSNKIFVIGNSLNYKVQKKVRTELLAKPKELETFKTSIFKENYKIIVFIGRLLENKKVNEIINSMLELNKLGLKLNCIIIGDGPEKLNLIEYVNKNKLQTQVYFANELYEEKEIAKILLISDVMVSPGNVGLNCIHALSYGVPVITHDNFSFQNPEVEAINPNKNGLLYKYGDFKDMTYKIKDWFSNQRLNIYKECIDPIETKFNPKSHADNINKAVLDIIKNG